MAELELEVPAKAKIEVDHKKVLSAPIDRGSYIVKERLLSRVHGSEKHFTVYFQEGNGEASESHEWTEETKAAFEVFKNLL